MIWLAEDLAIAVHRACPVILISVREDCPQAARVCYEIGNRHAPLFFGSAPLSFVTPDNEPMYQMLAKLHGVSLERKIMPLDFGTKISASVHHHLTEREYCMNKEDLASRLLLLQVNDALFPIGAYSHFRVAKPTSRREGCGTPKQPGNISAGSWHWVRSIRICWLSGWLVKRPGPAIWKRWMTGG